MKITGKRLHKVVGAIMFWVVFAGIFLAYSQGMFKYCSANTSKIHGSFNRSWVYAVESEKEALDVVMLGDSECYSAFSPMQLWNEKGIASFNYSQSGQKMQETYFLLKKIFEKQSPKVVMLETNLIFRKQPRLDVVQSSMDEIVSYIIPGGGVRLHDAWKIMCGQPEQKIPEYKGFYLTTGVKASKFLDYMNEKRQCKAVVREYANWYLDRVHELCEENGAELVLVSTPSTKNWNYKRHTVTEELAKDKGITYVDLNTINIKDKEAQINWNTDTRDAGDHLNVSGAQKATKWLGEYLEAHYKFTDKRQDEEYSSWNTIGEEYENKITPMIDKIRKKK